MSPLLRPSESIPTWLPFRSAVSRPSRRRSARCPIPTSHLPSTTSPVATALSAQSPAPACTQLLQQQANTPYARPTPPSAKPAAVSSPSFPASPRTSARAPTTPHLSPPTSSDTAEANPSSPPPTETFSLKVDSPPPACPRKSSMSSLPAPRPTGQRSIPSSPPCKPPASTPFSNSTNLQSGCNQPPAHARATPSPLPPT